MIEEFLKIAERSEPDESSLKRAVELFERICSENQDIFNKMKDIHSAPFEIIADIAVSKDQGERKKLLSELRINLKEIASLLQESGAYQLQR